MFREIRHRLTQRSQTDSATVANRMTRRSLTFGTGAIAALAAIVAGVRYGGPSDRVAAPLITVVPPNTPAPTSTPPATTVSQAHASVVATEVATPVPTGSGTSVASPSTYAEAGVDGQATPDASTSNPASSTEPTSGFGLGRRFRDSGTPLPLVGYPGAEWIPSPYHRPRTQTINTLVMHTTAGTLQSAVNEFQHSSRHVSAHYVVGRNGLIIQMVSENQVAFHAGVVTAGPSSRFYGTNPNLYSIGIEMENLDVITSLADFPAAQRDAVFKLAKDVVRRNQIPLDRQHIVAHSEIDPANRRDPGPGFPWTTFMAYLQSS